MLDRAAFALIGLVDRIGASLGGRKMLALLGLGGLVYVGAGLTGSDGRGFLRAVIVALLIVVAILVRALVIRLKDPEVRANINQLRREARRSRQ